MLSCRMCSSNLETYSYRHFFCKPPNLFYLIYKPSAFSRETTEMARATNPSKRKRHLAFAALFASWRLAKIFEDDLENEQRSSCQLTLGYKIATNTLLLVGVSNDSLFIIIHL